MHPFGKLKCSTCKWSWQPDWEMTKTARQFKSTAKDPVPVPILENELKNQVPYFTICKCGLTWRAKNLTPWWKGYGKKPVTNHAKVDTDTLPKQSYIGFEYIRCEECGEEQSSSWKRFSIPRDPTYTAGRGEYLNIPDDDE
jgi:ribosomal protein S14